MTRRTDEPGRREGSRRLRTGLGVVAASTLLVACSGAAVGGAEQAAPPSTAPTTSLPAPAASAPPPSPARAARPGAGQQGMVRVDGGTYPLGSADGASDEAPVHTVDVAPFLIDRHEVTNAQYAEFLNSLGVEPVRDAAAGGTDGSTFRPEDRPLFVEGPEGAEDPRLLVALDDENSRIGVEGGRFVAAPGFEDHPVVETSWRGARDYAAWRGARLPTEAEWEAAARGLEGRTYPWGEAPEPDGRAVLDTARPAPVGSVPAGATPEGVLDLAGNLAEWTSTLYRPYPYDPDDGREDPDDPGERVTRGGDAYFSDQEDLRAAARTGFSRLPGRGHRHIGFRTVRSA